MNALFADLQARGLVAQTTSPLLQDALNRETLTFYVGFDPTSDSLHIGSLLPLLTMRRLQMHGHKPLVVLGGATGRIGDPSGKTSERVLLDETHLAHNLNGMKRFVHRFLEPKGPNGVEILDNYAWFKDMDALTFLRDVGKHFTVNHMMAKESVRARLEDRDHGISYTEFSYMLLQAYDFEYLFRERGCRLQMGATDQWGNITAGCELIRRRGGLATEAQPAFGLTHPLVLKSDGSKFGKTESGTIWLDPQKTSPYAFFQFLIQTADADVVTMLKYFTFLPLEEIERLAQTVRECPEAREAQTRLAQELTRMVHGDAELERAERASRALFTEDIQTLDAETLQSAQAGAPTLTLSRARLGALSVLDALVESGLCASRGAAKKDLSSGGIYLNNKRVSDTAALLAAGDLLAGRFVILRKGKRNYHWIVFA
jgi:tyrosyl-tRNA synthetase